MENNLIVKYNNDLNLLPLPSLKALEIDILMTILALVIEQKRNTPFLKQFFNPNLRKIVIPQKTFIELCRLNESNMPYRDIFFLIDGVLEKLVKTIIKWQKDEKTFYNFACFEMGAIIADEVHITLTPSFYNLVLNTKDGYYTFFELIELQNLNGKYTKTLYRHLKQYRKSGWWQINWDEFLRVMDIPPSYKMRDIDKQILKPAISELTKEQNLFDQNRKPFQNLKYEKIKGKGRGRGGNVVGIKFEFKKTKAEILDAEEAKDEEIAELKKEIKKRQENEKNAYSQVAGAYAAIGMRQEFGEYIGRHYENKEKENLKIMGVCRNGGEIELTMKNCEKEKTFPVYLKSKEHLDNYLSKFKKKF